MRFPLRVNAQEGALIIIATVAVMLVLQWAEKFFIPLMLGILIAYTLNSPVVWLERVRIPRPVGTTLVMAAILCGAIFIAMSLSGQVQTIVEQLPTAVKSLSSSILHPRDGQPNAMQKVQAAAREIEKVTNQAVGMSPPSKQTAPPGDPSPIQFNNVVLAGSMGVVGLITHGTMVLFLVFFLLLAGDTFKRKVVRLCGPTNRQLAVKILDDINHAIQNYMFTLLIANTFLALLSWIVFESIGLDNAGGWAVAAGLLHVIPYFGPLLIAVATGAAAFLQFHTLSMVLVVAGSSLVLATLIGVVFQTWMMGKATKMNAAAVFIALLFWAWLWGMWGLLLGIPIVGILKVISEHVERLRPVAELLGE
jgi:predicted PurR-regulated permease PerM